MPTNENGSMSPQCLQLTITWHCDMTGIPADRHSDTEQTDKPSDFYIYTLNHKKRDILFLTITLANLRRFL